MGNIRLDQDDQPTREELLKIRGKDFKPVPMKVRRAEPKGSKR
jgi:hypothetical protein